MTEQEWLTSEDPAAMLRHQAASDRKLRLFSVAKYKLLEPSWAKYPEEVAKIERWIDGGDDPLDRSWHLGMDANHAAMFYLDDEEHRSRFGELASLLREIIGNQHRPVTLPIIHRKNCDAMPGAAERAYSHCSCPCPWLTTLVLSLAQAAYEEPGQKCGRCEQGVNPIYTAGIGMLRWHAGDGSKWGVVECPDCKGTGRIDDGTLDPVRLAVLADALEEAGCDEVCPQCHGSGTYTVYVQNVGLSSANGYGAATTYSEWRGCQHCGGDYDHKGSGRVPSPILIHLRSPGTHVRGCWVIDLLHGKA